MDVDFATNTLLKQFSSPQALQKAYGTLAKRLQMRLDILYHADCLADVPTSPPPRRHMLTGKYAGCFAVDVSGNWRIVFRPNQTPIPALDDGAIDLRAITAITVVEIVDYH